MTNCGGREAREGLFDTLNAWTTKGTLRSALRAGEGKRRNPRASSVFRCVLGG